MDIKDSSSEEEEEAPNDAPFDKFNENTALTNVEEIKSPINMAMSIKRNPNISNTDDSPTIDRSPSNRNLSHSSRFASKLETRTMAAPFEKSVGLVHDASDSDETDDEDDMPAATAKTIEMYNPMEFENLQVSAEVKELFENIVRFSPQKIVLDYKLIPFIPDYIPAVGDIDAFIKIPKPDNSEDKVGLDVLDEPCANQSDPAVLHLQLRNHSKSTIPAKQMVVKRVDNPEQKAKSIEKWINDMNQLQHSRHAPIVKLSKPTMDIDALMQQWPSEVDESIEHAAVDFSKLDCDLLQLVDIVCTMVDIPVYHDARIEALHTMFNLFLEMRNQKY